MPEKGRQYSIIGTNRYWQEFLAAKKNSDTKIPRRCRGEVCFKYIADDSSLAMDQRAGL
jgi:hypothetical protein